MASVVVLTKGASYSDGQGNKFVKNRPAPVADKKFLKELMDTGRFRLIEMDPDEAIDETVNIYAELNQAADKVIEVVKQIGTIEKLEELRDQEARGKARKTVIKAITDQIEALAKPAPSGANSGQGGQTPNPEGTGQSQDRALEAKPESQEQPDPTKTDPNNQSDAASLDDLK